jgi:hypothetical protein
MSKTRKHLYQKNDDMTIDENHIIVRVVSPKGMNIVEVENADKSK